MPRSSVLPSDAIATLFTEAEEARQAGQVDTAQALLDRILAHDAQHVPALYTHGLLALEAGRFDAAQSWIERAIELEQKAMFYETLCVAQIKSGAHISATQAAQRGLELEPESPRLHYYLALALQVQGRLDDAAVVYRKVLEINPEHAVSHSNLGVVAKILGALDEAEWHLRRAIELEPFRRSDRGHLGSVLLASGRYEEAWPYFEDRWENFVNAAGQAVSARPNLPLPQWRGENPNPARRAGDVAVGKARLLVIPEQGHGDSLQFMRYLPLALEHFAQVGFFCPPSLRRLCDESLCARWPQLVLLKDEDELKDWDWYCPLMSLPMAFGTRLDNIPAFTYLHADATRAASWGARLASDLPRVGVVWAGGHSGTAEDKVRSLMSAQIAPLLALPHVHWVSLQKTEDPAKRADAASQSRLTDWMDEVSDFADTAALIDNLDLVISVDTSVAHLAAAMGKPVWLLNRFAGCWRWLRDRDDSPWYPTVRIFTQSERGNWDDVLARVASALQQEFPLPEGQGNTAQ